MIYLYNILKINIMVAVHPQYITDTSGSKMVVLSSKEFDSIIDALEELDDIQDYDEFKSPSGTGL